MPAAELLFLEAEARASRRRRSASAEGSERSSASVRVASRSCHTDLKENTVPR